VRTPRGVRRARGPQEDVALAVDEARGVQVARAVGLDRAVEPGAAAQPGGAIGRKQRRGAVERHAHDPLVLAVEELLQRAQAREGQDRLALALDEQVELGRDVAEGVPLDRAAGDEGAERERQRQ
jgi:hypothetical protein